MRARGVTPWARTQPSEATSAAAAPSTTPEELPAWCTCSTRVDPRVALEAHLVEGPAVTLEGRGAHLGEGRAEPRQALHGGAGTRVLVAIEQDPTFLVGDRDERAVEPSLLGRFGGPALALDREGVDVVAGELLQRGDQVGGDPLRDGRDLGPQVRIASVDRGQSHRHVPTRHRLHPSGHHQILGPGADTHGGHRDRLLPRTTEPVERHAGHGLGPSDQERGQARDVVAVVTAQDPVPGDDVVDLAWVETHPGRQRGEARAEQALRVDAVQGAVRTALPPWRAHGVDDVGVAHVRRRACARWGREPSAPVAPRRHPRPARPTLAHPTVLAPGRPSGQRGKRRQGCTSLRPERRLSPASRRGRRDPPLRDPPGSQQPALEVLAPGPVSGGRTANDPLGYRHLRLSHPRQTGTPFVSLDDPVFLGEKDRRTRMVNESPLVG